jgi:hypothetical protein
VVAGADEAGGEEDGVEARRQRRPAAVLRAGSEVNAVGGSRFKNMVSSAGRHS